MNNSFVSVMKNHIPVRVQKIKSPFFRKSAAVLTAPLVFMKNRKKICYEMKGKRVLYYVEVFLTVNCSLRCKYCAACMPSYKEHYEISFDVIEKSIRAFMDNVDFIENVRLLGGEPFVYTHLTETIDLLKTYRNKIGKIRIVTNATVMPKNDAVLKALNDDQVVIDISNYGDISTFKNEWVDLEKKYAFSVNLGDQLMWSVPDTNYEKRGMSEELLKHKFKKCGEHCRLIRDGKLFYCGPSFWTMFCEDNDVSGDYVDLINNEHPETLHDQIVDLYFNKPYLKGCDNCPGSFLHRPLVTPAGKEQLPIGESQPFDMLPGFDEVQKRRI